MPSSPWFTLIVPDVDAALTRSPQAEPVPGVQLARIAGRGSLREAWDRRDPDSPLRPWQRGLLEALSLPATQFASAPTSVAGSGEGTDCGCWLHAEPVHFVAGLDRLSFLRLQQQARVTDAERAALAATLTAHFSAANFSLHVIAGAWYIHSERGLTAVTSSLDAASANELQSVMPRGPDAGELRRLMTELQMLLHEHPVNEARVRRGLPAINAVWLWGMGSVAAMSSAQMPTLPAAFGDEPYLRGIYQLHGQSVQPLPPTAGELVAAIDAEKRAIAVASVDDVAELEERWIAPLVQALAARRIDRLDLILDGWRLEVDRSALRRFWRRALPASQWLANAAGQSG